MDNVERVAQRAAQEAVERTLVGLGFDVRNPLKAQAQMAALRTLAERAIDEDQMKDDEFLRRLRLRMDAVTDTSVRAVVRYLVYFMLGLLVLGTSVWWRKHVPW